MTGADVSRLYEQDDEQDDEQDLSMTQGNATRGKGQCNTSDAILEAGPSKIKDSLDQMREMIAEPVPPRMKELPPLPPRALSSVEFNNGYLDKWKKQNRAKLNSPPPRDHGKWEGIWLAERTLRRDRSEGRPPGEDLWKFLWRKVKKPKAADRTSEPEHGNLGGS